MLRGRLVVAGLFVLMVVAVGVPAQAHHKPGHHRGPTTTSTTTRTSATTTTLAPTTTETTLATTTSTTIGTGDQIPPIGAGWTMAYSNTFEAGSNLNDWGLYDGPYGSDPFNWAKPSHVYIAGGMLHLLMAYDTSGGNGAAWYTGGMQLSNSYASNNQQITLRYRVVNTNFTNVRAHRNIPMHWGNEPPNWPANGEIDYMEGSGYTDPSTFIHYGSSSPGTTDSHDYTGVDLSQWNVIRAERDNHVVRVYINDLVTPAFTYNGDATSIPDNLQRVVLQQECRSTGCPPPGADTEDIQVSWITVANKWDPATATYGPDSAYTQPAGSVSVPVGSLNQALLDGQPNGTKFWLQSGIHRPAAEVATMLVPKQGQELHGASGAVLSGAVVLTGWTFDGTRWWVGGQTQRGVDGPELYQGNPISPADAPRSWKSETVWINNVIQKHQNALVDVGAGEWFFDYAANRIYVGTDPTGKTVETALADRAIVGGGTGVTVRNLVVEKFMTPIQVAAVDNNGATGWQLINCDVRWNHGAGTKLGDGGRTAGSRIRENGQLGVGGGGTGLLFERNEVATNNTIGIDRGFEAGGTKFVSSTDAQVTENWVHHNNGNGLWLDISNTNPLIQRNLSEDNNWSGIFQEIGFGGRIIANTVRRNGLDYTSFAPLGGGIVVTDSAGVEIANNILVDNRGGGVWGIRDSRAGGVEGYELRDLWVHDNDITMHSGLGGGTDQPGNGVQDFTGTAAYSQNNRYDGNRYVVTSTSTTFWYWQGGPKTWAQWQALPQDAAGTATAG